MTYYRRKFAQYPVYEWLEIGVLLCLAGGFMDAYTYVTRGGVFANAQTANLILMSVGLATGGGLNALRYLVSIFLFFCGVFLSELFIHLGRKKSSDFRAHGLVLIGEIIVLAVVGALPAETPDMLVNALVSFVAALQFDNFRKLEGNAFATAFCTGNLRAATQNLFYATVERKKGALQVAGKYFACILAFVAGVLAGYFASLAMGGYSIFLAAVILAVAAAGIYFGASVRRRRVRIRRIAAEELPAMRALIWESFEHSVAPSFTPEGVERFRFFLNDEEMGTRRDCFGVFAGGMLKGALIAEKDGSHICAFFVRSGEQKQGYGSRLMHKFLENVPAKCVTVNAAPDAVNAYKKLGFRARGDLQHKDGMAFVPMQYEKREEGGTQ